jgi:trimeric autotransporter adhesin
MRNLLLSLVVILTITQLAKAATYPVCPAPSSVPSGCSGALPFCTGTTYTFPNTTGTGNQGTLECLSTTPNPTWYYLEIATAGNIDIQINQVNGSGSGIDVDFALLGPYTSVAAGCSNPASACVEDCSYSTAASETANIVGAQVGEVYLLLLTNFANQAGTITFNQSGGSGATDCTILAPSCAITSITATPTNCLTNNQYNVSGQVSFTDPPGTGTLTVSSSCGGTQTFNAPFTSPISYTLSNINANGANCTITASFSAESCSSTQTYTSPTVPTVGSGGNQSVCAGGSVTLNGSGASTYTWNNGVTNGVSFVPASTTTYTVTGTNAQNCTNTAQATITVNALPVVTANDVSTCTGSSVSVSASGAASYSWSPSTYLSATTGSTVTSTPAADITYVVTGTSSAGCIGTDNVSVTVLAAAPIDAGSNTAICAGQSATLTASGGVSYVWNNGLGAGNGFTVSPAVTTVYTVVGTDGNGCTGTDDITVTINALPIVNAGVDQTVCSGDPVTLIGSGASTYSWNNGVVNNIPFNPTSTMVYIVTGTSAQGCTSSDQVTVNVNSLPIVSAGLDQVICIGESVTLSGAGASSYSWSGGISNGVSFDPTSSMNYTVSGTDANGCIGTDIVLVTVNPLPAINGGADVTVCEGDEITLAGAGGVSYLWSDGGVDGQPFTPSLGSTVYTVTGTDANGCVNTDEVTVTVLVPPTASIIADVQTGYPVLDVSFTNLSTDATSYVWSFGNSEIEQTTTNDGQFMSYPGIGTYVVELTASNGVCTDSDTLHILVIPFPDPILDIPNVFTPNGDGVNEHFTIDAQFAEDMNILIFNRWGNQVAEINGLTEKWDGKVDGKEANDGTYFFKFTVKGINGTELSGHGNVTLVR